MTVNEWDGRERISSTPDWEEFVGGKLLAWLGGVAVLVGIALFLSLAISHGWIDEGARSALGALASLALLAGGIWLRERRGNTEAALAAAATGVAGLFMTITVAAEVYDQLPALPAFGLAALAGATATVLAVRWRSQLIAGLGIVGALLAPLLVGAPQTATTVALLFTVSAATAATLVWQRWQWLGLASFCIATPQWLGWLAETSSTSAILVALTAFGVAGAATAIGFELRLPAASLRASSSLLLALNALVLACAGYLALGGIEGEPLGRAWLAGLAALHVLLGLAAGRSERISRELQLLLLTIGVLLANLAFAAIASGAVLAIGWAAASVLFATLVRERRPLPADALLAQAGLGGHLALAVGHALLNDATPATLSGDGIDTTALLVTASLAAACFSSSRLGTTSAGWRAALDAIGLAAVAYFSALALDGSALVAAWSLEAALLSLLDRRHGDSSAGIGAGAFLCLAAGHALGIEAPPEAFLYGAADLGAAALALAAVGSAAITVAWAARIDRPTRAAIAAAGAVTLLYMASVAIVSSFEATAGDPALFDLGVRERGQLLVSLLWAATGLSALVVGLRRDVRELRLAALLLLLATVGKVFLFDLAALTSIYRVISFVALGSILLAGSFAHQRLRPRPADADRGQCVAPGSRRRRPSVLRVLCVTTLVSFPIGLLSFMLWFRNVGIECYPDCSLNPDATGYIGLGGLALSAVTLVLAIGWAVIRFIHRRFVAASQHD